jgi:fatty-acid desaturase
MTRITIREYRITEADTDDSLKTDTDASRNLLRYAATRGLVYSHVGWIFYKVAYDKLDLIETDDLDKDPGM